MASRKFPGFACPTRRCAAGSAVPAALAASSTLPRRALASPSAPRVSSQENSSFSLSSELLSGTPRRLDRRRRCVAIAAVSSPSSGPGLDRLAAAGDAFARLFPLWTAIGALVGLLRPDLLAWFKGPAVPWTLGCVMLCMGTTLPPSSFASVVKRPARVALGCSLQFGVMPLLGAAAAALTLLPAPTAAGVVLVACCPGGTASNVITLLGGGDVALSVSLTAASTVLATILTPLLTGALAGSLVPVDGAALLADVVRMVAAPVALGSLFAGSAPRQVTRAAGALCPGLATAAVALLVGASVAASPGARNLLGPAAAAAARAGAVAEVASRPGLAALVAGSWGAAGEAIVRVATMVASLPLGTRLGAALLTLHGGGFMLGGLLARAMGDRGPCDASALAPLRRLVGPVDAAAERTYAIEVGMQARVRRGVGGAWHGTGSRCLHDPAEAHS